MTHTTVLTPDVLPLYAFRFWLRDSRAKSHLLLPATKRKSPTLPSLSTSNPSPSSSTLTARSAARPSPPNPRSSPPPPLLPSTFKFKSGGRISRSLVRAGSVSISSLGRARRGGVRCGRRGWRRWRRGRGCHSLTLLGLRRRRRCLVGGAEGRKGMRKRDFSPQSTRERARPAREVLPCSATT